MKLSVIIPTLNEEEFIETCLKSVQFADEIIVLDSGSTDKTLDIAKKYKAKIIKYQWQGFRYAHDLGAEKAQGEWLLYVDADERVSHQLAEMIQTELQDSTLSAYQLPRKNFILGQEMKAGGWYPDKVTRLIQKDKLIKWVGELHEYPQVSGEIGYLDGQIYHLTHRGINWMLKKTIKYTKLNAQILYENNHPPVKVKNFFGAMVREFWYRAVETQGWKDGLVGWSEIIYQTFNAYLIQAQLWELQQQKSMSEKYKQLDQEIQNEL